MMNQQIHIYKANIFKALAHPVRLSILDSLRGGEQTVTSLQRLVGAEQATISQHLKVLHQAHFLASRKEGTQVFYRTEDPQVYLFLDLGRTVYEHQLVRQREKIDVQTGLTTEGSETDKP